MAMTDKEKGNHGISAFIVEDGFEGFSIGKHEKKMGIRGSATASLVFEDCIVPAENLLGEEGQGFKVAMHTLDGGRIGIAAQALGIAEGALNEAIAYAKMREQFGKPLSAFQNTQFVIARSRRPSCWSTAPLGPRTTICPTPWSLPTPSCTRQRPRCV